MKIEQIKISDITPYEKNPRYHSELQIREMAKSLEKFGQIRPIVVDETGTILVGHCVRAALLSLGRDTAMVLRKTDLSPDEKIKLVLADNKIAELGSDNYDQVMSLIGELEDFDVPGFDSKVLDELLRSAEKALDDYGIMPGVSNEKPQPASNFFNPPPSDPAPQESIPTQGPAPIDKGAPISPRRFMTCPHCGGEIET